MTPDSLRWVKSSYSNNGGQCIEWAPEHAAAAGEVPVRDSKTPTGPHLTLSVDAWAELVDFAKSQS
ncbi:hypothetical protein SAZ_19220 [Streptomyces noursei ZPM]|uniref:DUF397 domain-containing protein n=1 Tax=Streptomyces noursei TaxID=1971 RepID=A0A401R218_STRNR|nr:DUF397 domain-containing protein [Streptomyces noursei]AKA04348.1 hypothetical protein SAZ_19220 [Streptomyces noursei ZPM]EOT05662.1 hypothetical protein K530_02377 [Streptomyces noursei CCRC 11814]EXU90758.1 hypothetical protein P354_12590 [Streptomyces noursei PD-1]UWS72734.1 DUF397 domain-containing protein [Streptomyces noursei]GCB91695.1 hypothetical protein SALB_04433 [Streptomyces noursei]